MTKASFKSYIPSSNEVAMTISCSTTVLAPKLSLTIQRIVILVLGKAEYSTVKFDVVSSSGDKPRKSLNEPLVPFSL